MNKLQHFGNGFFARHSFSLAVFFAIVAFVLACGGLVVANGEAIRPDDSHIVNVYVDGEELVIPTRAQTVGELLPKLAVSIGAADIVEPALSTTIDGDNFRIHVLKAKPTTIVDGQSSQSLLSPYSDPREAAEKADYALHEADFVTQEYPGDPAISRILGRKIVIDRALPVIVNLYGTPIQKYTHHSTVRALLTEMNIAPASDDTVVPGFETVITPNLTIIISKFGKQIVTAEESIARPTDYIDDDSLALGASEVRTEGRDGKKVSVYEITTENGVEKSRVLIQESVVETPINRVVARGKIINVAENKQALMLAAGIAESDYGYVDYIIGRESGWCATKWQGQWGICPATYVEKYPGAETVASLGFGLCQSTPASKMASAGLDWRTNPVTQLRWCSGYAHGRYGSWKSAYEAWLSKNWW